MIEDGRGNVCVGVFNEGPSGSGKTFGRLVGWRWCFGSLVERNTGDRFLEAVIAFAFLSDGIMEILWFN